MTATVPTATIVLIVVAMVLAFAVPILLAVWLAKKKGAHAVPFFIGCAVFLVFALISLAKNRAEKSYDGTVIDKSKTRTHSEEEGWTTEYTTVVRLTNGRTKKIKETDSNWFKVYDYLEVGDVFRYHPQFAFPYEVYDKSRKQHLYCVGCRAKNPVANDRCSRCNLPLLK